MLSFYLTASGVENLSISVVALMANNMTGADKWLYTIHRLKTDFFYIQIVCMELWKQELPFDAIHFLQHYSSNSTKSKQKWPMTIQLNHWINITNLQVLTMQYMKCITIIVIIKFINKAHNRKIKRAMCYEQIQ